MDVIKFDVVGGRRASGRLNSWADRKGFGLSLGG